MGLPSFVIALALHRKSFYKNVHIILKHFISLLNFLLTLKASSLASLNFDAADKNLEDAVLVLYNARPAMTLCLSCFFISIMIYIHQLTLNFFLAWESKFLMLMSLNGSQLLGSTILTL